MTPRRKKIHLRQSILSHRGDLTKGHLAAAAGQVLGTLLANLDIPPNSTVAAYAPLGTEPGGNLTEALSDAGHRVLLPVVLDDLDLDWAPYTGTRHMTRRGLSEPSSPSLGVEVVATAAALVVPALAVGTDGFRLGRGGGCYDRALARVAANVPVVALLHDGEWPRPVPHEAHDRPVTAVVTPGHGWVNLSTTTGTRGGQTPRHDA